MKQDKNDSNKNKSKDKSESWFCWCFSKKKRKTKQMERIVDNKESSITSSINDNINENKEDKSLPVIDNNDILNKPEIVIERKDLCPNAIINPNAEIIPIIEEKEKVLLSNEEDNPKKENEKEDKDHNSLNESKEEKSIENINKIKKTSSNNDNKGNSIQQNQEYKFNEKFKSLVEQSNKQIAITEETPRTFNYSTYNNFTILKSNTNCKNCITNRENYQQRLNIDSIKIDLKDEGQKNTENDDIDNNNQYIINDKNRLEFLYKRTDNQSINNELVHTQIDVKQFNLSTVNESYTKMQEKIQSIPNIIRKTIIEDLNQSVHLNSNQLNTAINEINAIQSNQIEAISPALNYINIEEGESNTDLSIVNDENYYVEENDEEMKTKNDNISKYSETRSLISSYVINAPKMISGINDSYGASVCSRSEYKETSSNFLPTEGTHKFQLIPHNVDDTEFEITNENGEGFRNFIETPRMTNLTFNFKKSSGSIGGTANLNPQFKEIYDKIYRKEREIKRINEKIAKMMTEIQKCEEENKKYDRWIEKEELEGEMLRHMLNFQIFK